jgi:hypothetical protein
MASNIEVNKMPNFSHRNFVHFADLLLDGVEKILSKISRDVPRGHIQLQKNLPMKSVKMRIIIAGQKKSGSVRLSRK